MTKLSFALTRLSGQEPLSTNYFNTLTNSLGGINSVMRKSALTKTTEVLVRFLMIIVLLITTLFLMSTESQAQDVYNFYFQKNMPAGANPPATQATTLTTPTATPGQPTSAANEIKTELRPAETTAPAFSKWEIAAYKSSINSPTQTVSSSYYNGSTETYKSMASKDGYALQGAYRFNKFFAAEAGVFYSTGWTGERYNSQTPGKGIDGSLGLVITPVHINLFGYELIEIAANLGVMSLNKYTFRETSNANSMEPVNVERVYLPYYGPKVSLNLSSNLAVVADAKLAPGVSKGAIGSVGLKFRF